MENYEVLSDKCKIRWIKNFNLTTENYKQVSGYVFNENNELLIVKYGDTWTIPGGHPELYEYTIGTLIREVMEEVCIDINRIKYLGALEVVENGEIYYQLRYVARIKEVLDFVKEWETSERKFVKCSDLKQYIKWCDGVTFKAQLDCAEKIINEDYEDFSISA